jgi:DNA-binding NtrC family response regulator
MSDGTTGGRLLHSGEKSFLDPVARLVAGNPFRHSWASLIRAALSPEAADSVDESTILPWGPLGAATALLSDRLAVLVRRAIERLRAGAAPSREEILIYRGAAIYCLWDRFGARFQGIIDDDRVDAPFYGEFEEAYRELLVHPAIRVPEPPHLFALYYQARRAAWFITSKIAGRSRAAGASREAIWRAIMGNDVCTYARSLYAQMDACPVLITGETGTGKDLAAQCIGWSGYIPFDPKARRFARRYAGDFHVRNLCEIPADLVASALFGHKKGSFTGADADALGFFALAGENGTLFLDEIGELPLPAQAKLLRPFESREYLPIGEKEPRKMRGRPLVATHRDLPAMIARGEFREDLYERMNGIRVHVPPLRELCADGGLLDYVDRFVGARIPDPDERRRLAFHVMQRCQAELGGHLWPRNLRELRNFTERCLLEGAPSSIAPPSEGAPIPALPPPAPVPHVPAPESVCMPSSGLVGPTAKAGGVDHKKLLSAYVTHVYVSTGQNKAATARITGFDRRTVAQLIDPVRLARLLSQQKKAG